MSAGPRGIIQVNSLRREFGELTSADDGDYTVTLLEEIAIICALGTLLLGAAVVAFNRRG